MLSDAGQTTLPRSILRHRRYSGATLGNERPIWAITVHSMILQVNCRTETQESICLRCGACCRGYGFLRLSTKDIEREPRLSKYTLGVISFKGKCPFLDQRNVKAVCTIYQTRPDKCRQFSCVRIGSLKS